MLFRLECFSSSIKLQRANHFTGGMVGYLTVNVDPLLPQAMHTRR
jgi:hypothetical protein